MSFNLDPVLTASAAGQLHGRQQSGNPPPPQYPQHPYGDLFTIPSGTAYQHARHPSDGGPVLYPGAVPQHPPPGHGAAATATATSESSAASSPDIASLLPPQHQWGSPGAAVPHPHPGHPGHPGHPAHAAPLPPPTQAANGQWSYAPSYDRMPFNDLNALREWARPDPADKRAPYPPQARHHPYLSEASSAPRHRALNELQPEEPRPQPPKSGRLGVKRRQKYTRSRTGCLGCRARRIKCDEGRPVCRRCQVAKRECVFPDPQDSGKRKKGDSSGDEEPPQPRQLAAPGLQPLMEAPRPAHENMNLPFDLSQAIPEGFGMSPMGWDRAFTNEGLSPSAFMFDTVHPNPLEAVQATIAELNNSAGGADGQGQGNAGAAAPGSDAEADSAGAAAGAAAGVGNVPAATTASDAPPLLAAPNFLLPWFPTAQEQSLILHYCANAADLMIAIPGGLNPMLAVNLPLALESPRGTDAACDALRITLLGIGAVHQAFLLARSGVSTTQTTATFQYASNLRDMGKEMVRRASLDEGGAASSDAALSASTSLATIDIFFGGSGWQDNFALAKRMVSSRGGPRAMLKSSTPTLLGDGVTVNPVRMFLEILAIYETFSCLTVGAEPELLNDQESWWFEGSGSTFEEYSVETQFGMSRVMVHLFSRTARLLAKVHAAECGFLDEPPAVAGPAMSAAATESALAGADGVGEIGVGPAAPRGAPTARGEGLVHVDTTTSGLLPSSVMPRILMDPRERGTDEADIASLTAEAGRLKLDIDAWIESLTANSLEHERVQVGNRAYAHAMKILLLRMVFGRPRTDPDVQASALEVLQHCSISTAALGMSIDLMWPAVVAGCCVEGTERQWLLTLLEGFKSQCCFDVDTASRIIQEVWRRVDAGEERADWKPVCDDFGMQVLLC